MRPTADIAERPVAVVADLHGNLVATEAVLAEVTRLGVGRVVIAGDIAWGPHPAETVAFVRAIELPTTIVRGNADQEVANPLFVVGDDFLRDSTEWCAAQVGAAGRAWLAGLPETERIDVSGIGSILVCHGSPRSDLDEMRPETDGERIEGWLSGTVEPVVVCGHTHVQFDRNVGLHRVVNPGSVGLHAGVDGAQWAILGPAGVELRTTPYDRPRAAELAMSSGIPDAAGFAAFLRDPTGT